MKEEHTASIAGSCGPEISGSDGIRAAIEGGIESQKFITSDFKATNIWSMFGTIEL